MRRFFALAALLFLSACGFTPVYGDHGSGAPKVQEKFQQVAVASIPDRQGQILRNDLIDLLYRNGAPADPQYTLYISGIQQHVTDLDITPQSSATRAELRLVTAMTLKERATDTVLLTRPLIAVTSYNILNSEYTTLVSQQNVRENALGDLAQQIETQLALYFARTP